MLLKKAGSSRVTLRILRLPLLYILAETAKLAPKGQDSKPVQLVVVHLLCCNVGVGTAARRGFERCKD